MQSRGRHCAKNQNRRRNKNEAYYTIGREFGSGGREVGQKLAERLNVPFYDKELISMAAKECDFSEAVLEAQEERPPKYFWNPFTLST